MRPLFASSLAALFLSVIALPAHAVPPTVTPSPGYDARLAEQRRALQAQQPPVIEKSRRWAPAVQPRSKRGVRR